jgi:hypothetical protein
LIRLANTQTKELGERPMLHLNKADIWVSKSHRKDRVLMKKLALETCLFVGKDGGVAIQLLEPPLPKTYQIPPVPPGMMHAARLLGLTSTVRSFNRTVDGLLPIYEEI